MPKETEKNNKFSPAAMLPAWFVTDENFYIVNRNSIFSEMFGHLDFDHKISSRHVKALNFEESDDLECENIWERILTKESLDKMNDGLEILSKIVKISKELKTQNKQELFDKLKTIKNPSEGIKMYYLIPQEKIYGENYEAPDFLAGVKIAPSEGLELKQKVKVAESVIEYIDITVACRFNEDTLVVEAIQPAIHDCTEKHYFWAEFTNQLSRLMVHAFKNPLGNTKRLINSLEKYIVPEGMQKLREIQVSNLQALNLSKLFNFANHGKDTKVRACKNSTNLQTIEITLEEIKKQLAMTAWNLCCGAEETWDRNTAKNLLSEFEVEATQTDLCNFEILAEKIVSGIDSFYITLEHSEDLDESVYYDLLKDCKGKILELLLDEMMLNAIKKADHDHPCVSVKVITDANNVEIQVCNNGNPFPAEWFQDFDAALIQLSQKSGNKRHPLGLRLNREAANILGVEFKPKEIDENNHFVLTIPLMRNNVVPRRS